jgi:hypothetical protein
MYDLFPEERKKVVNEIMKTNNPLKAKKILRYREADNNKQSCKNCINRVKKVWNHSYAYRCKLIGLNAYGWDANITLKSVCDMHEEQLLEPDKKRNLNKKPYSNVI